ncbi:MAG TPA: porin, partial [Thermoanaerobaculia bacterium]
FGIDSTPASPAKDNLFLGRRHGIGSDAQLELGPLEVWSEYLRVTFEPASRVPAAKFRSEGWYGQAAYYILPNKLQIVGRIETFDPSSVGGGDATRSTVSGVNWYFKGHDLKLQLDWMRSRVPGLSSEQQKVIARLQTVF